MLKRWVYYMATAIRDLTEELGRPPDATELRAWFGHSGAYLLRLQELGLPIRPCCLIPARASLDYADTSALPEDFWAQLEEGVHQCEATTGQVFGGSVNPLLLVIHSASRSLMPGTLPDIWYLGMNRSVADALVALSHDPAWVYRTFINLVAQFAQIVHGVDRASFGGVVEEEEEDHWDAVDWRVQADRYLDTYREHVGEPFPEDPYRQLEHAVRAALEAWHDGRAVAFREREGISHDWGVSLAVTVDVYGRYGNESGRGFALTRNPATGAKELCGEYRSQSGSAELLFELHEPLSLAPLRAQYPAIYAQLTELAARVEAEFLNLQELSFTVDRGRLWVWSTTATKCNPHAAARVALDMVAEGMISRVEALERLDGGEIATQLRPVVDDEAAEKARLSGRLLWRGIGASPGAAVGAAALDIETAAAWEKEGRAYILIREVDDLGEIPILLAAEGVVTRFGGIASRRTYFFRDINLPAVTGVTGLEIDHEARTACVGDVLLHEGEVITIDGTRGELFLGPVPLAPSPLLGEVVALVAGETGALA